MRRILAWALAATLLVPGALAAWSGFGAWEPDTSYDVASGRMFADPDTASSGKRVYFNAFPGEHPTAANPNAMLLRSRVQASPNVHFYAVLGAWKDCNRDGTIGLADTALLSYRSALLLDPSICGAGGPFNDGTWVNELLTIGMPDPCVWEVPAPSKCAQAPTFVPHRHVLYANGTAVWGDLGVPGTGGRSDCPVRPLPAGTTSGSGYLLAYGDCFFDHYVAKRWNDVTAIVDPQNAHRLRFEDPRAPQTSSSRLNVHFPVNLYGSPITGRPGLLQQDSGDEAFTVFDCARGTEPAYDRPQADPFRPTPTRTVRPEARSPTGSYWDATLSLQEELAGDCDSTTGNALRNNYGLVYLEGPVAGVDASQRSKTNVYFTFVNGHRRTGTALDDAVPLPDMPPLAGLGAHANATGPLWIANAFYAGWLPPSVRTNLTDPVDGRQFATFYARLPEPSVAEHSLLLPRSDAATYGSEATACGSAIFAGATPRNGWVCDPTRWWRAPDGTDVMPYYVGTTSGGRVPIGQTVGASYHLRDVDCIDGRVVRSPVGGILPGNGVYASLVPLTSEGPCVDP